MSAAAREIYMRRRDPSEEWGIRIRGGRDVGIPLILTLVKERSQSQAKGLRSGDLVVSIGGDSTNGMTHQQAQQAIIRCGNELSLVVVPGGGMSYMGFCEEEESQEFKVQPKISAPVKSAISPQTFSPPASNIKVGSSYISQPAGPQFRVQHVVNVTGSVSSHSIKNQQPRPVETFNDHVKPMAANHNFKAPSFGSTNKQSDFMTPSAHYRGPSPQMHETPVSPIKHAPARSAPRPKSPNPNAGHPRRIMASSVKHGTTLNSTGSVPICAECAQMIRGPFIAALDFTFCPEHFVCSKCRQRLDNVGFVEHNGRLFCEADFAEFLAPRCKKCNQPVIGEIVLAMGAEWHPRCFTCCHCRQMLSEKQFRLGDDSQPYCERDWQTLFGMSCDKCGGTIESVDRFLEALGKTYHAECFKCAACQTSLEGKPFVPRDGKAFCKAHARAAAIF